MVNRDSDEYKIGFHDGYKAALNQIARICPELEVGVAKIIGEEKGGAGRIEEKVE